MTASAELLRVLDSAALDFNFPVLDNVSWKLIAARLRGFRHGSDGSLVFEIFAYHTEAYEFAIQVYAFGSGLGVGHGFVDALPVIESAEADGSFWDDSGEWIPRNVMRVSVWGEPVVVVSADALPVISDAETRVVLSAGENVSEATFARGLARELGLMKLMPASHLFSVLPDLAEAVEVLRLSDWDHPDIAGGMASSSQTLRSAAAFVTGEVSAFDFHSISGNVQWSRWQIPGY